MGLFSSKTVIHVASSVYNLAGDVLDRPNYLKTLVVQNNLSGGKSYVSETIRDGYAHGPENQLKSFYRWAKRPDNYDKIGMPTSRITTASSVDSVEAANAVPHNPATEQVWVQTATYDDASPTYWAEQYLLANRPELIGQEWELQVNEETGVFTIIPEVGDPINFTASNFDYTAKYIYIYYSLAYEPIIGPVITGETHHIGSGDFPETTGWTLLEDNTEEITEGSITYRVGEIIYTKTSIFETQAGSKIHTLENMYFYQEATIEEVEEEEVVIYDREYRIDTQETTTGSYGSLSLYIYKIGSGNPDLDAVVDTSQDFGEFFPVIPVRIDNKFVSNSYLPDAYTQIVKGYKKATRSEFSELIDSLSENPDLDQVDYVHIHFGVSLNVLDNSSRKYIYRFFERMLSRSGYGSNQVRVNGTTSASSSFDIRIIWDSINKTVEDGLYKPTAKVGDAWVEKAGSYTTSETIIVHHGSGQDASIEERVITHTFVRTRIYLQESKTKYSYIELINLRHLNYVYGGKAVETSATEALDDAEESVFIIPLHYDTWNTMSVVDSNQIATSCIFLVLNAYELQKIRWYQRGIFQVVFVVVIAVASVFLPGIGMLGAGLLGTNVAIGTFLGFTGIYAAIAGSVINALAAMVLMMIISPMLSKLGIIGQILSFVITFAISGIASGLSSPTGVITLNWGNLLKAENLLKLTDSIFRGYADSLNMSTMTIAQQMSDFNKKAQQEAKKIQQAYLNEFGYGAGIIDPMMFVDSDQNYVAESSDTFLTRTLMTGSEIAEMSRELLYGFPEYSLKLPDAFT